jgi:hypothetical protein
MNRGSTRSFASGVAGRRDAGTWAAQREPANRAEALGINPDASPSSTKDRKPRQIFIMSVRHRAIEDREVDD